jgi:glycosyltransferase involved in cell wall biosynthesis
VHAIPNPVKMFNLNIADTRNRRIVSVGRLEEVKGHKYLIEAFARIDNKGWELHIIGDGSMRDELENLADSLKLGDFVTFHGHLIDFEEILSTAEIFVLPSIKEGFPNALIEAMSVPLACVSGDYYEGSPEIIEDGINGLLFEPRNVEALSNTLQMLVENDKLRESLKAKAELVKKKYNLDKIGLEYLKIFRIYESKKNSK